MRPVLTVEEMRAADAAAMRTVTHEALVARAGLAAALAATRLLGRVYGSRVVAVCGPGANGEDGRVAARHLAARGARVEVLDLKELGPRLEGCDLVVDAAFGTGLSRPWEAPEVDPGTPVLAVDVPSGVDPDTGSVAGRSLPAVATVAMGGLKRGHLVGQGAVLCGDVEVAPLGIDARGAAAALVEDADLSSIAPLERDGHKWRRALVVVAGSPSMLGAPSLVCDAALCAQAGMVLWCGPEVPTTQAAPVPVEVVRIDAATELVAPTLEAMRRARAAVLGPGLGRDEGIAAMLNELVERSDVPIVLDADALHLVAPEALHARQSRGAAPVVLTPHDGEYAALMGAAPGPDRFAAARAAAERTGCTVLLKGPTTVVATASPPDGVAPLLCVRAPADLATPGTGDVLAGVVGALLARGTPAHLAAALGAHLHAAAARALGARCRAGALPGAVAAVLEARRELDHGD